MNKESVNENERLEFDELELEIEENASEEIEIEEIAEDSSDFTYDEDHKTMGEKSSNNTVNGNTRKSVLYERRHRRRIRDAGITVAVFLSVMVLASGLFLVFYMNQAKSSLEANKPQVLSETQDSAHDNAETTAPKEESKENETTGVYNDSEVSESDVLTESKDEDFGISHAHTEESTSPEVTKETQTQQTTKPAQTEVATKAPITDSSSYVNITASSVTAKYAALYDVSAGKLIAGKNPYTKIYPSSMTKVMTLIVACETIKDWDKTTALTQEECNMLTKRDASRAGYYAGDVGAAKDLIYGMILRSGCEASIMLARIAAGTEEEFAKLMNDKCSQLGLKNTHFTNSSGLHDEDQYSTMADMCRIMEYAMSNDMCREVLGKESYTGKINSKSITWIHNNIDTYNKTVYTTGGYCMNKLNAQGITVMGVKSGYTKYSLNCLVTYVTKNGKPYIAVVSGVTGKGYSTINSTNIFLNYIK